MAKTTRLLFAALLLFVVIGIVAAGCGSSSSSSTTEESSGGEAKESAGGGEEKEAAGSKSAGVEEAKKFVSEHSNLESLKYPEPPQEPYNPGKGKLGIVTCSTAGTGCLGMAKQTVAAAEAAGWEPSEIGDGKFTPSVQAGIIEKYVQEGYNGIVIDSIDLASVKSAVASAIKAGIPLSCVMCTPDPGFGPNSPVPLASTDGKETGEFIGTYVVANSKPGERILQFRDKAFPIMIERGNAVKETIEEKCPECVYEEQQIATEELTKPGPPYFTAALAAHPEGELGWAFAASDTYNIPAVTTTEQQGREVKFAGSDGEPVFLEDMLKSPEIAKATVWNPFNYAAWAGVDEVVRVAAGLKPWEAFGLPVGYIDSKEGAEKALKAAPNYYSPPAFNYEAMFKKLWSGK
ncbi:MAG: substrate-binding domain-containing protein [Actinobacteria bacterium]|nr:substrate-binding domain-containing protein [Actinomycetota bacterium]